MDRLWAPWRIKYIKKKMQKKCVFCESIVNSSGKSKHKKYIITKSRYAFSILNNFPYNNGHIMVLPKRHVRDLSLLKDAEILDLFKTLIQVKKLLSKVLKPQGYNIGINIAKVAGAGITGHLHIHIVPRWEGDTNFMPALCDTKIISQSLDELYKSLKAC